MTTSSSDAAIVGACITYSLPHTIPAIPPARNVLAWELTYTRGADGIKHNLQATTGEILVSVDRINELSLYNWGWRKSLQQRKENARVEGPLIRGGVPSGARITSAKQNLKVKVEVVLFFFFFF